MTITAASEKTYLNAEAKHFADVTKALQLQHVFTSTTGKHCKDTPEDQKFTAG
jgi:hypothetical protein